MGQHQEPQMQERRAVTPGPNPILWSWIPVLQNRPNSAYLGRVFVEAWGEDARVVFAGHNKRILRNRSIEALQGEIDPVEAGPKLTNEATAELTGQPYLGRVIVEIWDDQAVVAMQGPNSGEALMSARKILDPN